MEGEFGHNEKLWNTWGNERDSCSPMLSVQLLSLRLLANLHYGTFE